MRCVTAMAFLRRGRCFALTHACDRYFFSGDARAADVRQKDFSYLGRWKGVSGSVPEAL